MLITIGIIGQDKTIHFAAEELARYIKKMDPHTFVDQRLYDRYEETDQPILWVGLENWLERSEEDRIMAEIKDGAGYITGSNPRAVLLCAYRVLREWGCRWLGPAPQEEILPERDFEREPACVSLRETPSYGHRVVSIEGAVGFEHVLHMIDWAPKMGMNGYHFQFLVPYCFFDWWYTHRRNSAWAGRGISAGDVKHMVARLMEEVEKRGLTVHAVGHGWTCEPFHIPANTWDPTEDAIPEDLKGYFAEISGKREFWGKVPLNTNLCYSQPEVRKTVTDAIADYCRMHPEVDVLHFWLADDFNNHCECAACRQERPADFYVRMLNELDEKLTAEQLPVKIVFLAYRDLLWAPETQRIRHPERFILMFAPITRTYSRSYAQLGQVPDGEPSPYQRNRLNFPVSLEDNVAYLRQWQAQFSGDSFTWEYHLWWDHVLDPGHFVCARTLHEDIVHLKELHINGLVISLIHRVGFPVSLPTYVMALTLWDRGVSFDMAVQEYFTAAFGEDGPLVREYLSSLSACFDSPYLRREREKTGEEAAASFLRAEETIRRFLPVIEANMTGSRRWKTLYHHGRLSLLLAEGLRQQALGEAEAAKETFLRLREAAGEVEREEYEVFDANNYIEALEGLHVIS